MTFEWEAGVRDPVRLAAFDRTVQLGSFPEDAFDCLTELAVEITGAPRACITLVDSEHTRAKSMIGFPEGSPRAAPVEQSFCRFVVATSQPLIVDDARRDPRTSGDAAIDAFEAGAWAGYPIEDRAGATLGTFCLMDPQAHEWTTRDLHVLATLATAASAEIALRSSQNEVNSLRHLLEASPLAAVHERLALTSHLRRLIKSGEPDAHFARDLVAWLAARDEGRR